MRFLGLDWDSARGAIEQFLVEADEEERLRHVREHVEEQARAAEEAFYMRGVVSPEPVGTSEDSDRHTGRPRCLNTREDFGGDRFIVVPCGCSICASCYEHTQRDRRRTCPVCYNEITEIVRAASRNVQFGEQLIQLLGHVLIDFRHICRSIATLNSIDFDAISAACK